MAEEEIAKRALAALEPPRDDSPAVMHLRSENARLRAQLKYAWKQVAEVRSHVFGLEIRQEGYGLCGVGSSTVVRAWRFEPGLARLGRLTLQVGTDQQHSMKYRELSLHTLVGGPLTWHAASLPAPAIRR